MSLVTDLQEARELIAKEENWCKGKFAVDKHGYSVAVNAPTACKWCAAGAIERSAGGGQPHNTGRHETAHRQLSEAAIYLFNEPAISIVNDQLGHEETLLMFDVAIRKAKGNE